MRTSRRMFCLMCPWLQRPGLLFPLALNWCWRNPGRIQWHDVQEWGVEGRGFSDTESYFDRLPGRAKGVVRMLSGG